MTPQFRAALGRALLGAIVAFGGTYYATITTVEDDCGARKPPIEKGCEAGTDTKQIKALAPSVVAVLAYLGTRAGVEGAYDSKRQKDGNTKPGDVTDD